MMMTDFTFYFTIPYSDLRSWMPDVPIMIVASSAWDNRQKRLRLTNLIDHTLFCDSGGFLAARRWGDFPYSEKEYVDWLKTLNPTWCATMDYCLEPELKRQDKERFIQGTVEKAEKLMTGWPYLPWVPVIQGYEVEDYLRCAELYREAGLIRPYMGIGSLCRRERDIERVVSNIGWALPDTRFHLFGVKLNSLGSPIVRKYAASSDSAAWQWYDGKMRYVNRKVLLPGVSQRQYKFEIMLPRYLQKVRKRLMENSQLALF